MKIALRVGLLILIALCVSTVCLAQQSAPTPSDLGIAIYPHAKLQGKISKSVGKDATKFSAVFRTVDSFQPVKNFYDTNTQKLFDEVGSSSSIDTFEKSTQITAYREREIIKIAITWKQGLPTHIKITRSVFKHPVASPYSHPALQFSDPIDIWLMLILAGILIGIFVGIHLFLAIASLILLCRRERSVLLLVIFLLTGIFMILAVFYPLVVWRRDGWKASRWLVIPYFVYIGAVICTFLYVPVSLLSFFIHIPISDSLLLRLAIAVIVLPPLLFLIYSFVIWKRKGRREWSRYMAPYAIWFGMMVLGSVLSVAFIPVQEAKKILEDHTVVTESSKQVSPSHSLPVRTRQTDP